MKCSSRKQAYTQSSLGTTHKTEVKPTNPNTPKTCLSFTECLVLFILASSFSQLTCYIFRFCSLIALCSWHTTSHVHFFFLAICGNSILTEYRARRENKNGAAEARKQCRIFKYSFWQLAFIQFHYLFMQSSKYCVIFSLQWPTSVRLVYSFSVFFSISIYIDLFPSI